MRCTRQTTDPHRPGFVGRLLLGLLLLGMPGIAAGTEQAPLADRQAEVRNRLQRLEDQMVKLVRVLDAIEPGKARRLETTLEETGRRQLRQQLENATLLLRERQLGEADFQQERILDDLNALLVLLKSNQPDLDRLRAEREWLAELREQLDTLIEAQVQQRMALEQARAQSAAAAQLAELAEALEALAERQALLQEAADQARAVAAPPDAPPPAAGQRALERDTQAAIQELQAAARAGATPQQAAALSRAQQAAQQARQSMSEAAEALPQGGKAEQQAAAAALSAAAEALREAAEEAEDAAEPRIRRLALAQSETQEKARQLQRAMQQSPGDSNRPAPGEPQVGEAAGQMQQAADEMRAADGESAAESQDQALRELARAQQLLEERLRQVREEERAETLSGVESRLQAMLDRERDVRDMINLVASLPVNEWTQAQRAQLGRATERHLEAMNEGAALVRLLRDEGTTVVLPDLMGMLLGDMESLATAMLAEDLSPPTRALLDEIIAQLEQMLAAVQAERETPTENPEQPPNQPPNQGGQQRQQALMKRSAELKLLRTAQARLNDRTERLAQLNEAEDPLLSERFAQLGARQEDLARMTRQMIERDQ